MDEEKEKHWGRWLGVTLAVSFLILALIGAFVAVVDPFFHFHGPLEEFAYTIDNERYQNDGISRHYDYDSVLTGTSMIENVKPSLLDELFGGTFIKIPYGGGFYKEVDESLRRAFDYNPEIKTVIREIDKDYLLYDKDDWNPAAAVPDYLWDKNPFNDVKYIWNKDIILGYASSAVKDAMAGKQTMTLDEYMHWAPDMEWGREAVLRNLAYVPPAEDLPFTEEDRAALQENIDQNILQTVKAHPDVTFYMFSPPYSIAYWNVEITGKGNLTRLLTGLRMLTDELLECDNVRFYGFDTQYDIICDLDNFMDDIHYSEEIGDWIMTCMADGEYLLTKENVDAYFEDLKCFYSDYDYASVYE